MKRISIFILFLCVTLCLPMPHVSAAHEAVASIWAVNDGERVEKYDLDSAYKSANSAWDGGTVRIFGGRNEVIAFQVIVEAGPAGVKELTVALPSLKLRGGDAEIVYKPPARDPTDYLDRPISIFTEHYMEVSRKIHTTADWIIDTDDKPDDPYGWKPVQLIPENAKPGTGSLPVSVDPKANQGLWFEIYTAKDLPAGFYDGEITITADSFTMTLPVELRLFDFTLPDENSVNAMVFYDEEYLVYDEGFHASPSPDIENAYHRFAHRQRVELVMQQSIESVQEKHGIFDGSLFTAQNLYDGPGVAVGNRIIPRSFYGLPDNYTTKAAIWEDSDAWMSFISRNYPRAVTFLYMPDEPQDDESRAYVRSIAEMVKSNPGIGGSLPVFVTSGYNASMDGVSKAYPEGLIDIWDMNMDLYHQADAVAQRAEGDDFWVYNGMRPFGGAPVYECPATDMRANVWQCFKANVSTYFYWQSNHWRNDTRSNVWTDAATYRERDGTMAVGDGVLVYPGEYASSPADDRGITGPCSGVSMANLRRGLQDHLYLTMARDAGHQELVDALLEGIVPDIFADKRPGKATFAQSGDAFEAARRELAEVLSGR